MRVKRRRRSLPEMTLRSHLKNLGFEEAKDYQDWCDVNGFRRNLDKSPEDRRCELVASLTTGPIWEKIPTGVVKQQHTVVHVRGSDDEVVSRILSGHLSARHVVDHRFRPLQSAVSRLRGSCFHDHLATFRKLLSACALRGFDFPTYGDVKFERGPNDKHRSRYSFAEALASVALHAKHWRRDVEDWVAENSKAEEGEIGSSHLTRIFRSLVQHLFVKYSVPPMMYDCWFHTAEVALPSDLAVFLHLAAGHSIRTARTGISCGKKTAAHFLHAPTGLSVPQALRWAQVRAMGGEKRLALQIATSVIGENSENPDFWKSVIHWFVAAQNLDLRFVRPIIVFLNNQRFGVGNFQRMQYDHRGNPRAVTDPPAQPRLTMARRKPDSLVRDMLAWQALRDSYGRNTSLIWDPSEIEPFEFIDAEGTEWRIRELRGNGSLAHEGSSMRHCVADYAELCAVRATTVWSLTAGQNGSVKRSLTIEVDPDTNQILQARGLANRLPHSAELAVVRRWAVHEKLSLEKLDLEVY